MRPRPVTLADLLEGDMDGVSDIEALQRTRFDRPHNLPHQFGRRRNGCRRLELPAQSAQLKARQFSRWEPLHRHRLSHASFFAVLRSARGPAHRHKDLPDDLPRRSFYFGVDVEYHVRLM